tara:strand:- start:1417 stop:1860 length:444 start_codon:yes stop_codon:yes gene_type:complete
MATLTGELGQVKVGTTDSAGSPTTVAEIRSWTITHNQDTIEDTVMGDGARTYKKGITNFSGSFEGMYDTAHISTNGAAFDLDATTDGVQEDPTSLAGEFITSTVSGSKKYGGQILITSIERSASFDDMVTFTANFQGSGALTESAVS